MREARQAEIFNIEEAAIYCRISAFGVKNPVKYLRRLCADGKIPHTRVARRLAFRRDQLDQWLGMKGAR